MNIRKIANAIFTGGQIGLWGLAAYGLLFEASQKRVKSEIMKLTMIRGAFVSAVVTLAVSLIRLFIFGDIDLMITLIIFFLYFLAHIGIDILWTEGKLR